eukprot:CAMPEP_0117460852 /NCGR_PEP_ID=MMETSP0784-20121206/2221_1 /TAXON_ID=39447 /ORGANISM="" /LENGTH=39 /DNA_ID= /DNA_START= /DNA_END= /DNA_ORIENTATION=
MRPRGRSVDMALRLAQKLMSLAPIVNTTTCNVRWKRANG